MRCDGCGAEGWLKTVVCRDDRDRRGTLCDPCYEPLAHLLWIVPGHFNVTGRCDSCGRYVHPREIEPSTLKNGAAKRDIYTGLCRRCMV